MPHVQKAHMGCGTYVCVSESEGERERRVFGCDIEFEGDCVCDFLRECMSVFVLYRQSV